MTDKDDIINVDINKLTQEETRQLVTCVLRQYIAPCGMRLRMKAIDAVANRLKMKPYAITHIWRKYKESILEPEKYGMDLSRKQGSGGQRKMLIEALYALVKAVPFSQ